MQNKKVLIVEDEAIPALELGQELESMGLQVVGTARSGEEAIKAAHDMRPDLVLMDIRLKGDMDGIEAAIIIQKEMDIPIIYLSAYSDDSTAERLRQSRLFWFLHKPYMFEAIRSTIMEATASPPVR